MSDITPFVHDVPSGFMTCPVPGHKARISLKIQESQRADFKSRLERLLHKYEDRRQQFLGKAEKYEALVFRSREEGNVKPHVIEKYEKKAYQARGVANGADEEVKRLQSLLEQTAS
ncbi:hypothetical protein KIN20_034890 [Parelaphostrongylus tenuis]|uniref:Uncharacterized protein n=1 Tax=Parelaphostrongylus tenuis TaxID=148309 RepID=A0AAD5WK13_PARTN|nr:hypothetical protein KIN20_034890 [Parelaphostrongylus tenuis]